jgi:hypothetical protein
MAITWAQRLKRVFNIDIDKSAGQLICTVVDCREAGGHMDVADETCPKCGGGVKVIACIEDPVVIKKILIHLDKKTALNEPVVLPQPRAPPQASLFN